MQIRMTDVFMNGQNDEKTAKATGIIHARGFCCLHGLLVDVNLFSVYNPHPTRGIRGLAPLEVVVDVAVRRFGCGLFNAYGFVVKAERVALGRGRWCDFAEEVERVLFGFAVIFEYIIITVVKQIVGAFPISVPKTKRFIIVCYDFPFVTFITIKK